MLLGDVSWQERVDFIKHARPLWAGNPETEPGKDFAIFEHALEVTLTERRRQAEMQPVVAAIVTSPLGVLVGRRNDGKPPWTFIAGEVEPGERPEDAAVREVKEETGLLVRAGALIGERVHPKTGRTMVYMSAMPTHGTDVFVGDADELAEVRWVGLAEADELLPGMFGPVREHLARELGG
jgi:8-oxo-dGTP diphosphatase